MFFCHLNSYVCCKKTGFKIGQQNISPEEKAYFREDAYFKNRTLEKVDFILRLPHDKSKVSLLRHHPYNFLCRYMNNDSYSALVNISAVCSLVWM